MEQINYDNLQYDITRNKHFTMIERPGSSKHLSLSDMVTNKLLELTDGTYEVTESDFVEETQVSSQIDDFTNSDTEKMVIPETQVTPRIKKETHTTIPGKAGIESLQDFLKTILSEMKNMRSFLKTVEQRIIQIEDTVIGSNKSQCNRQNQESEFFVDLIRNRISTLERELIEENAIIDFPLKERSKPVSYKKENISSKYIIKIYQNIIIDANQENEEGTKPRNSAEKKKGNQQRQQTQKRNILC